MAALDSVESSLATCNAKKIKEPELLKAILVLFAMCLVPEVGLTNGISDSFGFIWLPIYHHLRRTVLHGMMSVVLGRAPFMSFRDLHNPKAAARLFDEFRKRYQQRTCLAPFADHGRGVVAAHTLAVGNVLRPISKESHVYALNMRRFTPGVRPFQIQRMGIGDVSSIHAFCANHDKSLFACIEDQPFRFTPEQRFKLAYRAASRECYLKRKQLESYPKLEDLAAVHGISGSIAYTEEALIYQAGMMKGTEEAEAFKASFDKHLLSSSWGRVVTAAVIFPKRPSVVAAFAFEPFFDLDGRQLQSIEDLESNASQLAFSLIPLEQGGAAIFSWLDTANGAPRAYYDSVLRSEDFTSTILHVVFDNGENFAISPEWFEALSPMQKSYIDARIPIQEAGFDYEVQGRPERNAPFLDDWGVPSTTFF